METDPPMELDARHCSSRGRTTAAVDFHAAGADPPLSPESDSCLPCRKCVKMPMLVQMLTINAAGEGVYTGCLSVWLCVGFLAL